MGKKLQLLVVSFLIIFSVNTFTQNNVFKPFRFDVAGLFDLSLDKESGTGGGFTLEPRYGINDNFVMGLRVEGTYINNSDVNIGIGGIDVKQSSVYAIMFTGDYYFSLEVIRPFIGLEMGVYHKKNNDVSLSLTNISTGNDAINNFGIAPRVGINIKHFKLAGIFNFTGKDITNYFGIQAGIEFGGGYK